MIKWTSKLNNYIAKTPFAVFAMAVLIGRLFIAFLPQAVAQDNGLTNSSDIYAVSAAGPNSMAISELENENGLVLQSNIFLQPVCFSANGCSEENKKQVEKTSIEKKIKKVIVTAYSSTPDQTDSSPFITANGTYVYDGIVACNFLPFDTKVKFPEMYGDKIFIVEDRMAKKNSHKIDIWMPSRTLALQFGVKSLAFEIVE
ncbi:MAG: hypothetical protein PHQ42_05395 [Patescibacteria group bacterium]|nr:hypothetical protein [Patescibacteria group bacterium]